jgi:hypothetical protein
MEDPPLCMVNVGTHVMKRHYRVAAMDDYTLVRIGVAKMLSILRFVQKECNVAMIRIKDQRVIIQKRNAVRLEIFRVIDNDSIK